jgi:hypothetical protein
LIDERAEHVYPPANMVKREIMVNGAIVHVNSIFTGQRTLDDALKDIVMRRIAETERLTA